MTGRVTALGCVTVAAMLVTSLSSPLTSIGVMAPVQGIPLTASWGCLTHGAAETRGIFAAGVRDAACPARSHLLALDGALEAPGAPTNLTASVTGSSVTLTWLVPASPDPATSYVIEVGAFAAATSIAVFDTLSTATSLTATGVPPGTYFVRVRARNYAGAGGASNEVVVVPGGGTSSPWPVTERE